MAEPASDILNDMIAELRDRTNNKYGSILVVFSIDSSGTEKCDWTMRCGDTTVSSQDGRKVLKSFCDIIPVNKPPF